MLDIIALPILTIFGLASVITSFLAIKNRRNVENKFRQDYSEFLDQKRRVEESINQTRNDLKKQNH